MLGFFVWPQRRDTSNFCSKFYCLGTNSYYLLFLHNFIYVRKDHYVTLLQILLQTLQIRDTKITKLAFIFLRPKGVSLKGRKKIEASFL